MSKGHLRLKRKYKIILIVVIALAIAAVLAVFVKNMLTEKPAPEPIRYGDIKDVSVTDDEQGYFAVKKDDSILTFMTIDVGQAEALFIDYKDFEVLIDAGSYNEGSTKVVDTIKPYVDGSIDVAIATHVHEDHVGGFSTVLDNFTVDKFIYGDRDASTTWGAIFEKNLQKAKTFEEDSDMTIVLGPDATLTIFDVTDNMEDPNANSVVCLLTYGKTKFFMSGDLEKEQELLLRNEPSFKGVDLVVAGHHGSETSNTLLDVLRPTYLLVSCGANNDYHHPHKTFLELAKKYSSQCYATYKSGTLVFESDGNKVKAVNDFDYDDRLTIDDVGAVVKKR